MEIMEYEEIELLKQSEKSTVYLVREMGGEQVFVRKILKGRHNIYFVLQSCLHPYLPKIYDVAISDDTTMVIEEYVEGQSLGRVELPEEQLLDVVRELCSVLGFLHGRGIIHRDIKPSNIILAKDGHIRLIDFDAARMPKDDLEQDTTLLGTRGYAPPEQYGFAQTDERSDIYSLGVTLGQILGNTGQKLRYKRIARKCMEPDRAKRYQSARQVERAFFHAERSGLYFSVVVVFAVFFCGIGVYLSAGRENVQGMGQGSVQLAGEEGVQAIGQENTQFEGQEGVRGMGEEDVQVMGQESAPFAGQEDVQGIRQEGVQFTGQEVVQGIGQENAQFEGQEGVQGMGQKGVQPKGQDGIQSAGTDLTVLPAPDNPHWDGETGIGLWGNVPESGSGGQMDYRWRLYRKDTADSLGTAGAGLVRESGMKGNAYGSEFFAMNFASEFFGNGFYYFEVSAVGDGIQYADSPYVMSDVFEYTGESAPPLPVPTGLAWKVLLDDGGNRNYYAVWDNLDDYEDTDSFDVCVYDQSGAYVINNIWRKENIVLRGHGGIWIDSKYLEEADGAYRFTVRALTSRPNEYRSSLMPNSVPEEYFSPWLYGQGKD